MLKTMLNHLRAWAAKHPIKRPTNKTIDSLEAILRDLREAEESIVFLRRRLEKEVRSLRENVDAEEDLPKVATYIYWILPEVSSVWLADTLVQRSGAGVKLLHKWVEPIPAICQCCKMEGKVFCRSREDLTKLLTGEGTYRFVCGECRAKQQRISVAAHNRLLEKHAEAERPRRDHAEYQQRAREHEAQRRLWELRRVPYAEYLQTPEWQTRRKQHLESVGYQCQLCNASEGLCLHHRNYERRGQERFPDLIVLCRYCHEHFHRGE